MSRNRRLLLLVAAVVAAAAVAIVLIVVGTGGGSSGNGSQPTTATTATAQFLAGVPQHGATLGRASASATLFVFEDPQCPFCQEWSLNTLPTVVEQFVKTGQLKLVWRGVEIIGPNSEPGLRAAYAAARQNKLWNLVDALYQRQGSENSGWITETLLRDAAKSAGVNAAAMLAASGSTAVTANLVQAAREANQDRLSGTPTFVLQRPLAQPELIPNSADPATFVSTLASALQ